VAAGVIRHICAGSSGPLTVVKGVTRRVALWAWWIPVVVGLSLPIFGFTPRPQWGRVHLIPFTDPDDKPRDQLVNIVMFIPLGYLFARGRRMPRAVTGAIVAAAMVSTCAEATQLFSTERNPSATDLSMAVAGAAIGSVLSRRNGGPSAKPASEIRE
jgi:glycopeptide antibiotics resistance protein